MFWRLAFGNSQLQRRHHYLKQNPSRFALQLQSALALALALVLAR